MPVVHTSLIPRFNKTNKNTPIDLKQNTDGVLLIKK